ncbi:MAG: hypothetical protein IJ257_08400 [Treponema sp.]|nr:hypothetical protein [Treponema sp.]
MNIIQDLFDSVISDSILLLEEIMVLSILIGFGVTSLFFSGELSPLSEMLSALPTDMQQSADVSVSSILLDIIPRNVVSPIIEGNMLQIIFILPQTGRNGTAAFGRCPRRSKFRSGRRCDLALPPV